MTKRIIGLVLALCLVVGLLPMIALADDTHTHTPGPNPTVKSQENASLSSSATVNGKYEVEYTCTECGQTYTEDVAFGPALLHYKTAAEEGATETTNYNTWAAGNVGNSYKPRIVMNPGDAPRYFVTKKSHDTFVNNSYVAELTDQAKIAAGEWNMKLEYPVLGTPTLTLKGADISNTAGLWLGRAAYTTIASYNIIVAEDSTIAQRCEYTTDKAVQGAANLNLFTTGVVTISGPGKLILETSSYGRGAIYSARATDIIFDGADIDLFKYDSMLASRGSEGIYTKNGSITIKDSTIKVVNYCPSKGAGGLDSYRGLSYPIYAGKDVTIDSSVVSIAASLSGNNGTSAGIRAVGKLTIKNSDVTISHGGVYYGRAYMYGELVLDYTNGYKAYNSGSKFSYNAETRAVTFPTGTEFTEITTANMQKYFVQLVHNCFTTADDFDCTTAEKCDICGETVTAAQNAHTPAADDGNCTTAVMCANEGCQKVATAAAAAHTPEADDGDCTTAIKCSVCGTETTAGAASHVGGTATCKDKAKCTTCGKEYGELLTTHVPNADDGDCTTAITCSICGTETTAAKTAHTGGTATCKDKAKCTECGKEYGELSTTHVPGTRTDCTVDTMCTVCGEVAIAAGSHTGGTATCKDKAVCTVCNKAYGELLTTHIPNADDGDCTTAITCSICGVETTAAKTAHTGGTATCKDKAKCTECGKEYGELLTTHVPNADDGDCTTAITCSICGVETTAAKTAHTGGTATCKAKAKCTECGKEYGELKAHTPAADDGDCTTAIKCSVCGAETTAAAAAHTYTDDKDTTCNATGCTNSRTVVSNPQTGDSANLPLLFVLMLISAAGIIAMGGFFLFTKLRKQEN